MFFEVLNPAKKIPVFFHIPKNAGTHTINTLFTYCVAWNGKRGYIKELTNKCVKILDVCDNGNKIYRIICTDYEGVCKKDKFIEKIDDWACSIELTDISEELASNLDVFAVAVVGGGFSRYKEDFSSFFRKDISFFKFSFLREPFSRAKSMYFYSQSDNSSHEKLHNMFEGLSFEEYLESSKLEDSWLIRNVLKITDDVPDLTEEDFKSCIKKLEDLKCYYYKECDQTIKDIVTSCYNIKEKEYEGYFEKRDIIDNKNKDKQAIKFESLPIKTKKLFEDRTLLDYHLFNSLLAQSTYFDPKQNKRKIINCFHDESENGFGDFLRGCTYLYNHCKSQGVDFDIDISKHRISKFFKKKPTKKYFKIHDICKETLGQKYSFHSLKKQTEQAYQSIKTGETKYISSNYHPVLIQGQNLIKYLNVLPSPNKNCSDFFKKNLPFSDDIEESANKTIKELGIRSGEFDVLHFRLGDQNSFSEEHKSDNLTEKYEDRYKICIDHYSKHKKPIIILSDSNEFKEYVISKNEEGKLFVLHLKSNHVQKKPSGFEGEISYSDENLFYAVFDMKIVTLARSVKCFSIYYHGSGFIYWMCKIYGIPIHTAIID